MKMAGVPVSDPAMVRARERILEMGGPLKANVFTKIQLALFGEYDWNGVPAMPVEIMLLPQAFFFNLSEVSYWSRTVIVPLLVIMDRKPVKWLRREQSLDELWPEPREQASLRFPRMPKPFSWRGLLWKSFFIAVDDALKIWERFSPRPFRRRALEAARLWLEERLAASGGLGGIYPAMANSLLAMRLLGYPDDHPLVIGQLKEVEALAVETENELHSQPCPSPVWDTSLAMNALLESGCAPDHPVLRRAAEWLLERQVFVPGDWQAKRPWVHPGGWAFQYANDFHPDLDDSAMVLMALEKMRGLDADRVRAAKERGLGWFLGMQGADGGWSSFEADNDKLFLNNIPFADHGALLDPSTEDLTGRGLELLGTVGYGRDFEPARRALGFIRRTQRHDGPWFGRWGVNYIYGTWSVFRGLKAIGESFEQEYIQRAVRWLESHQNPDGGWGETCEPGRTGNVDAEPDGVGIACAPRGGSGPHRRRRARRQPSARPPARRWRLGRSVLERHRLPGRLHVAVPPLREIFPPLGSRGVPARPRWLSQPSQPSSAPSRPSGGGRSSSSRPSVVSAASSGSRCSRWSRRRSRRAPSSTACTTSATARP